MKPKSIQAKLFYNYSLLIISVIIVIVFSFYFYISDILQRSKSEVLFQLSGHISTEFDSQIKNMNSASTKILFSEPLHELFFSDMFEINKSSIDRQRRFNNIIFPIIGYDNPFKQINMFRLSGEFANIGDVSRFTMFSPSRMTSVPWVNDTLLLNGKRYITLPHSDSWKGGNDLVISLCRAFPPGWGEKVSSILEVQQDYQVFADIIENAQVNPNLQTNKDIEIYVMNEQGLLIYPLGSEASEAESQAYWKLVNDKSNDHSSNSLINSNGRDKNIIAYSYSEVSNWTVIAAESKKRLLAPVNTFRNIILLLGILTIFITLAISYLVSRSLTIPIKKVQKSIKLLSLNTLPPKTESDVPSSLNELEHLNLAFNEMRLRLQQSLEETVASRAHELEAHNFALQAQMNPHFLYNTITNISILAEESGQQSIVEWCERLSQMLRYISSNHAAPVPLSEELEHTSNYLNLMKLRYEDNIQFVIDVPEPLQQIEVPKLIVQPIVENAMKYGIHVEPPWIISITGTLYADRWELIIHDNGHGFEEERIRQLTEQFRATDPLVKIPTLRINGMGLLNIYSRLKLLFGNRFAMNIANHPHGGALVSIIVKHEPGERSR
ncbi:histidine kinase [Paenibacillus sp. KQZ6P-2]|uniref:Histidine kinase n=1 Tax=Paenibacillus mangrovi TaxID=2931978 RepID=A0A9X1WSG2_9BACL|nr:histidine kinase [Paenibacillus mangrovi]MCJ8014244.1 histidine kinase [Paenibacillus mangrovi]